MIFLHAAIHWDGFIGPICILGEFTHQINSLQFWGLEPSVGLPTWEGSVVATLAVWAENHACTGGHRAYPRHYIWVLHLGGIGLV